MSEKQPSMEDRMNAQTEASAAEMGNQAAMRAAASTTAEETLMNPNFLRQIQDADVDSEVFDWLSDDMGPVFSGAHVVGNRRPEHEHRQDWLNRNKQERMITERTPGRLLQNNPHLLAVAQDVRGPDDPEYRAPITSRKRRAIRDAMEAATNLQSLSVDATGLESVTTATTESRVVKDREEESSSTVSKAKQIFK
jgi:hypothetical protein